MVLRKEDLYPDLTVTTKWSKWDDCFITACKEYNSMGVGETEEESVECFYELVGYEIDAEKRGKLASRPKKIGRPKKDNEKLAVNVSRKVKFLLGLMAEERNTNIGQVVNDLVIAYAKEHPEETYNIVNPDYQEFLESMRA